MESLQIHEIESVILGSLMIGAPLDDVSKYVNSDDFHSEEHKIIFKAISQQVNEGKPVDAVSLYEQGINIEAVISFNKYAASISNVEHYARQLADYSATQKIKRIMNETSSSITPKNHLELTSELIRQLDSVLNQQMTESCTWEQVIAKGIAEIDRVIESGSQPMYSDLRELDERLKALHGPRLIILAARPGIGKTALAQQMVLASAKQGKAVGIISLEMSVPEIAQRSMANYFDVNGTSLARGNIDLLSQVINDPRYQQFIEHRIFVDDCICELEKVIARITQWKRKNNIDFAVVDYIGLIELQDKGPRNEVLGVISRSLKQLCKRLDMPILALAQLNREIEKDKREPRLSDLRDSGAIEQDADMVIVLTEQSDEATRMIANDERIISSSILKNRVGPTGSLNYWTFKGRTQSFIEKIN